MNEELRRQVRRALLLLYGIETGVAMVALGAYRARTFTWRALPTKAGIFAAVGATLLLASLALLLRAIGSRGSVSRRALALGSLMNAWSLTLALALPEAFLRRVANPAPAGIQIEAVRLLPTWPELVTRSRAALSGVNPTGSWDESFLVHDPELGWTVGPSRRDQSGRYFSSQEGLRSAEPGVRIAARQARSRVALIGDSNAFSLEVAFAGSWGSELERLLGPDVQVLNFGVDAYGIDQMYLRYERDVRPWHPNVVVVGFIGHDLLRSMAVYPFISFEWPGFLVKPRFALESGRLRRLNPSLPDLEAVLGASRIQELPLIEYDLGYGTADWAIRPDWAPVSLRLLTTQWPRFHRLEPQVSAEATVELNRVLLETIRAAIERDGAAVIFVEMSDVGARDPIVDRTLAGTGIELVDTTQCLAGVPVAARRTASRYHFTAAGNSAVAACTAGPIASLLRGG